MQTRIDHDTLRAFRARALPPKDMLRVDRMLRQRDTGTALGGLEPGDVADLVLAERVVRRVIAEGAHPPYEQLEALVDGHAEPALKARIDLHVRWCPSCARELAELHAQAAVLRAQVPPPATVLGKSSWLDRWWSGSGAMAGAAVAAVMTAGVISWHTGPVDGGRAYHHSAMNSESTATLELDASAWSHLARISPAASAAYASGRFGEVAELLRPLAAQGSPIAAECLGLMLVDGQGMARDKLAGMKLLRIAANAGSASAQRNLIALQR